MGLLEAKGVFRVNNTVLPRNLSRISSASLFVSGGAVRAREEGMSVFLRVVHKRKVASTCLCLCRNMQYII